MGALGSTPCAELSASRWAATPTSPAGHMAWYARAYAGQLARVL